MDIKVLLQAFNQPWMIHPESAQYFAMIAARIIAGDKDAFKDNSEQVQEFAFVVNASGKKIGSIQDAVDTGVAVINLKGAVMKYDYCGAPGTQSLIQAIQTANDNAAISAIVLQIDSPGGSVDGTEQLANAVKNSAKPIVAYINGMMCSAAMWIGSAAKYRIAAAKTNTIGSVGTMASWNDYSGYLKQMGIQQHEVYATDSTHKNLPFREANGNNTEGKTNYEPLIKTWLDPLNSVFQETIQENLPDADKSVLNGSAYIATIAKEKGLIDQIGTFELAVNEALKLSKISEQQQTNTMNKKWTNLMAFLGIATAVTSAKDIQLEDTQADSIESVLAENQQLKADLQTIKDQLATAILDRDSIQGLLDAAQTKISTLEKQDAVIPAAAVADKDNNPATNVDAAEMDFQKELFAKL